MSLEAMVWALKTAEVPDPISHLVLIGLADHADTQGRNARPSVALLSEYARCSPRSVQRKLRTLEDCGLIWQGDQRGVEHLRSDRRPVVYDLNIRGVSVSRPVKNGVTENESRGANLDQTGCHAGPNGATRLADRTVLEPSLNRPVEPPMPESFDFADFWAIFPRKTAKAAALKAWTKAVKSVDAGEIIRGARRYADDPNRDPQFTVYPATWLNAGRWEDEPLPARTSSAGPRDRQGEILQREMEAARAADAARFMVGGGAITAGGGRFA
ncbi:helix-turn-helix DNA binding domain protein [Arthrobacter phage Coral]|uniref:Helix-turn-helix DNA binding domain protein n=1 Tax=Arthrobacter phage Coral TaxID=2419951 RepID=A0A3G2KEW2_9CAUD|nr:replication initiation protein [Arthrobacter phage Coral]AYN57519.1 helix-turn-helix DNA binding domain protein [Arthrobacter phage Coral]